MNFRLRLRRFQKPNAFNASLTFRLNAPRVFSIITPSALLNFQDWLRLRAILCSGNSLLAPAFTSASDVIEIPLKFVALRLEVTASAE
jgi:hypothetical protein